MQSLGSGLLKQEKKVSIEAFFYEKSPLRTFYTELNPYYLSQCS